METRTWAEVLLVDLLVKVLSVVVAVWEATPEETKTAVRELRRAGRRLRLWWRVLTLKKHYDQPTNIKALEERRRDHIDRLGFDKEEEDE